MTRDVTPAIVRDVSKVDQPTKNGRDEVGKIVSQPHNTVSSIRGLGESGYKVQVVKHDCPRCSFDRMIRRIDVNPELSNEVRYWCLNPNCVHFVSDELSYACHGSYPQMDTDEPTVFEQSDA